MDRLTLELITPDAETLGDVVHHVGRLASVDSLGLSDPSRVQPLVGDLLADAAERLDTPIVLLNVVVPGSQIVAGAHGISGWLAEARATPVEWSLCAQVVRTGAAYVVPDWSRDPATSANPLHTVDGLRAYAGVPLVSPTGHVLGAVCVLDRTARDFGEETLAVLTETATAAMDRLVLAADAAPRATRG